MLTFFFLQHDTAAASYLCCSSGHSHIFHSCCWWFDLTRANKIAIQATAQMAADKEAVGLSRVNMCESKCIPSLRTTGMNTISWQPIPFIYGPLREIIFLTSSLLCPSSVNVMSSRWKTSSRESGATRHRSGLSWAVRVASLTTTSPSTWPTSSPAPWNYSRACTTSRCEWVRHGFPENYGVNLNDCPVKWCSYIDRTLIFVFKLLIRHWVFRRN